MKICSQEIHGCMLSVVLFQMVTWTVVSVLLFNRGLSNFLPVASAMDLANGTSENKTSLPLDYPTLRGYSAGIVILIIATMMMIVGPLLVIIVLIEKCYRKRRFQKVPQEDPPPKYEDVVLEEMAPRYSTLFLNCDSAENNCT